MIINRILKKSMSKQPPKQTAHAILVTFLPLTTAIVVLHLWRTEAFENAGLRQSPLRLVGVARRRHTAAVVDNVKRGDVSAPMRTLVPL